MPRNSDINQSLKNSKTSLNRDKHESERLTAKTEVITGFCSSQNELSKIFCETLNDCLNPKEKSGICDKIFTGAKSFCYRLWAKEEVFNSKKEIKSIVDKFHDKNTNPVRRRKEKKNKKIVYNKSRIEYIDHANREKEKKNWLTNCNQLDCIQEFAAVTKLPIYNSDIIATKMERYFFYTKLYDKIYALEKKYFDTHYADNSGFILRYAYKTSLFLSGSVFSYLFNSSIIVALGFSTCLRAIGYEENKEWNESLNLLEQATTALTLLSLVGQMGCNSVKIIRDCQNIMVIFKNNYKCINTDSQSIREKKITIYNDQITSIKESKVATRLFAQSIIAAVLMRGIIVNGSSAMINIVPSDQKITATLVGLMRLTTSACMFFSTAIEFSGNLQFLHFAQNLLNLRNTIDGLKTEDEIKSFQCLRFDLYKSLLFSDNKKRSSFIGNSFAYFFASASTIASTAILIGVASTVDSTCQNISQNATLLIDKADPQNFFDPFLSSTMNCTNNVNFVANFVEGFNPFSILIMDCSTAFAKIITIFFLSLTSTGASNVITKDLLKENLVSPIFSADLMRFLCTLASCIVIPIGRLDKVKEFFSAPDKPITPGTVTLSVALDAIGTIFTITKVLASGNELITDLKLMLPCYNTNDTTKISKGDNINNAIIYVSTECVCTNDSCADNRSVYDNIQQDDEASSGNDSCADNRSVYDNVQQDDEASSGLKIPKIIVSSPSLKDISDSNVEHDKDLPPQGKMQNVKVVDINNMKCAFFNA